VRLLGMGGMGLVYQAHDTELGIEVALKVLRPELASRRDAFERFRQELLLARQVSSPHVVRIHDLVKHENSWLISMDYVPGMSLERLLDQRGSLPPDEAIVMLRQLALGLAAAHHSGVVHRDLKPANVLINEKGEACITDFGVARSAGDTGITDSGIIIGTPAYLSPEQAKAEPLDGRSDLYALGLIFFEMLTGTLPFRGGTPAEMMMQRIVREPPSAATVKPELPGFAVRLCAHLLELKPAHRFQTANEVVAAIDSRRVPGAARRRRYGIAIATATVLLVAGWAGFAQWWAQRAALEPPSITQGNAIPLDVAALPLTVASDVPADGELARGISRMLADNLASRPDINGADFLRVSRSLAELRFDADAAQRQLLRVFEVTNARQLVTGSLTRDGDGRLTVTLSAWKPGAAKPVWSKSGKPVAASDLAAELGRMQQALDTHLGLAERPSRWPESGELAGIGKLSQETPDAEVVNELADQAQANSSALLWWALLEALDRASRNAELASIAQRARDSLVSDQGLPARRTNAYALLALGESEKALNELRSLLKETPHDNTLGIMLARAQADLGSFDDAIQALSRIVGNDQRNIDAWYGLGKYSIQSGDSKRAVDEYLVRAQVVANRLEDVRMQAEVGNALGTGYRRLGQFDAAAERFQYSAPLYKSIKDARGEAKALRNLATVRTIQGDFDTAEKILKQVESIVASLGDSVASADLANAMGLLAEERGDYQKALEGYRDALRLRQSQGDLRLIGESQINVGFCYFQLGEFDNAQTYWQQASATYSQIDDRAGLVHAGQSLGLAEIARGDWQQARRTLEDALRESESMQMAEESSVTQASLAELDRLEGRMDSALELSQKALDTFRQREDQRGIVEMKLLQSAVFADLGDWSRAAESLADLEAETISNGEQASQLTRRKGEIALGQGEPAASLKAADGAITQASKSNSRGVELSARLLRARSLLALSQTDAAARELTEVRQGLERYASAPMRLLLAEAELQHTGIDATPTYLQVRSLLARLPAYARAFLIHGHAAARLPPQAAAEARASASKAFTELKTHVPAAQEEAIARLAQSAGVVEEAQ